MKKYIVLGILLFCLGFNNNVLASEIIINGTSYDDTVDINGEGFYYDYANKTLYLDGYNGGIINAPGELNVIVANENFITSKFGKNGIQGTNVSISGNGVINITKGVYGISGDNVMIKDIGLHIADSDAGILASKDSFNVLNAKIIIENCNLGMNPASETFFENSKINILNVKYGLRKFNYVNVSLKNSDLYLISEDFGMDEVIMPSIINSRLVIKSKIVATQDKEITISSLNKLYVSDDDLQYIEVDNYQYYNMLKLAPKEEIDSLILDDSSMLLSVDDLKEFMEEVVLTPNEYTENEYEKIEIVNPMTFDGIYYYLALLGISILLLTAICWFLRRYG